MSTIAIVSLAAGGVCCLVILFDLFALGHRQQMWIMDVVWPVTALFGTVLVLAAYFAWGRLSTRERFAEAERRGEGPPARRLTPFAAKVAKAALHCGSGCTLGDIVAETLAFLVPGVAVALGWGWLFGDKMFAVWVLDYAAAFGFGIAFQYFTIKPMRDLTPAQALGVALKADALSLTSWQVGMYGWMALARFVLFPQRGGAWFGADAPQFWFMMQIAMLCGLATAYPVNWWLLRRGIKEEM